MELKDIPIGTTEEVASTPDVRVTITRDREDAGLVRYMEQITDTEVMRGRIHEDGSFQAEHIDSDFWSFELDGEPVTAEEANAVQSAVALAASPEDRTVRITTSGT